MNVCEYCHADRDGYITHLNREGDRTRAYRVVGWRLEAMCQLRQAGAHDDQDQVLPDLRAQIGGLKMAELKPCPFCGCDRIAVRYLCLRPYVICMRCHAQIPCYNNYAKAKEAWNRRAGNDTN